MCELTPNENLIRKFYPKWVPKRKENDFSRNCMELTYYCSLYFQSQEEKEKYVHQSLVEVRELSNNLIQRFYPNWAPKRKENDFSRSVVELLLEDFGRDEKFWSEIDDNEMIAKTKGMYYSHHHPLLINIFLTLHKDKIEWNHFRMLFKGPQKIGHIVNAKSRTWVKPSIFWILFSNPKLYNLIL